MITSQKSQGKEDAIVEIEAKVMSDGDYEDKSQYGVTSVRNVKELERKVKKIENKAGKHER